MENKKKMIFEIDGNEIMDKGFEEFMAIIKKAQANEPEFANMPMPESMEEMLKATYQHGFQDGCVYIAEYISDIMEGQGKVSVNKN
jgi:hypothetical protein